MKLPAFGSGPMGMDFFTLDEAADRMSNLLERQITPQNLLDYGVQDKSDLVFSVYVNNWFLFRKTEGIVTRDSLDGLVDLHPWTVKELRAGKPVEVTWVRACKGADICAVSKDQWGHDPESWRAVFDIFPGNNEPTFPWISRSDLRIRRSELERLELLFKSLAIQDHPDETSTEAKTENQAEPNKPDPFANETNDNVVGPGSEADVIPEVIRRKLKIKRGSWQEEAYLIASRLDPKHKRPNIKRFAKDVHEELRVAGVKNRSGKTPPDQTIERDVLRGWKTG